MPNSTHPRHARPPASAPHAYPRPTARPPARPGVDAQPAPRSQRRRIRDAAPARVGGTEEQNHGFRRRRSRTPANAWQIERMGEERAAVAGLRTVVPQEDPAECGGRNRCSGGRSEISGRSSCSPRTDEPFARRRYWPIFEAAERGDLPIAMHIRRRQWASFHWSGWPTYYMEEHHAVAGPCRRC